MKYIRTKDGRIIAFGEGEFGYKLGTLEIHNKTGIVASYEPIEVLKVSDTIEELCDEFVEMLPNGYHRLYDLKGFEEKGFSIKGIIKYLIETKNKILGAIWTDKGLIYVAKMNEKGELELL